MRFLLSMSHRLCAGAVALSLLAVLCSCSSRKASPGLQSLYDAKADPDQQVAAALQKASRASKHVLLQFGANWCPDCHAMHALFRNHREIAAVLKQSYVLVMIDVNRREDPQHNTAIVARYEMPTARGIPALVILDSQGKQLTTQQNNPLTDTDHQNPEKVLAFLRRWAPVR